jgi:glycosyltransferase involved in cell wall biosynthesis
MKEPEITVLMSVYNGDKYLRQAIDSILNQTFEDFEFLIINDGSTDNTAEILQSYHDPRIKTISNRKNEGLIKSLNKGLEVAKGIYIARQDADDISESRRLETQVQYMENHKDIAAVGSSIKCINAYDEVIGFSAFPISPAEIRLSLLLGRWTFAHGAVMLRNHPAQRIRYDENALHAEDYDLWLKLSRRFPMANINDRLYNLRIHDSRITARFADIQQDSEASSLRNELEGILGKYIPKEVVMTMSLYSVNPTKEHFVRSIDLVIAIKDWFRTTVELSREGKITIARCVSDTLRTIIYRYGKNFIFVSFGYLIRFSKYSHKFLLSRGTFKFFVDSIETVW